MTEESVTDSPICCSVIFLSKILPFDSWAVLSLSNCITLYILFVFFGACFFFVCTFTNCLSLFSLPLCFMFSWKNKQTKNLPEKQFYSMNIKPRLEDPINLFHYLQHLSFSFFFLWSLCQGIRVCLHVCVFFYYRPPIRKCASWYCWRCSDVLGTVCVCVCIS